MKITDKLVMSLNESGTKQFTFAGELFAVMYQDNTVRLSCLQYIPFDSEKEALDFLQDKLDKLFAKAKDNSKNLCNVLINALESFKEAAGESDFLDENYVMPALKGNFHIVGKNQSIIHVTDIENAELFGREAIVQGAISLRDMIDISICKMKAFKEIFK